MRFVCGLIVCRSKYFSSDKLIIVHSCDLVVAAVAEAAVEAAANLFCKDLVAVDVLDILFHAMVAAAVLVLEEAMSLEVEGALCHKPCVVALHEARILVVVVLAGHNILLVAHPTHSVLVHTLELSTSSWYVFLWKSGRLVLRMQGSVDHILQLRLHCIVEIQQNDQHRKAYYHVVFVEMEVSVYGARDQADCRPTGVSNRAQSCRNPHLLINLEFAASNHQSLLYFESPSLFVVVETLLTHQRYAFSFRLLVATLRGRRLELKQVQMRCRLSCIESFRIVLMA